MNISNKILIPFESDEHRLEKLKEWELVTPTSQELQPRFKYRGIYRPEEVMCKVIGYEDRCTLIIEFEDGERSAIHPDYLKTMQKKLKKVGPVAEEDQAKGEKLYYSLFADVAEPTKVKMRIGQFVTRDIIYHNHDVRGQMNPLEQIEALDRNALADEFMQVAVKEGRSTYLLNLGSDYDPEKLKYDIAVFLDVTIPKLLNKALTKSITYNIEDTGQQYQFAESEFIAEYLESRIETYKFQDNQVHGYQKEKEIEFPAPLAKAVKQSHGSKEYEEKYKSIFSGIGNPSQIKTNISMYVKKNVIYKPDTFITHDEEDLNRLDRMDLAVQFIAAEADKKRVYGRKEDYNEDQFILDVAKYMDLSIAKMFNKMELGYDVYDTEETDLTFQFKDSYGIAHYLDNRNNFYSKTKKSKS